MWFLRQSHKDLKWGIVCVSTLYLLMRLIIPLINTQIAGQVQIDILKVNNKDEYVSVIGRINHVKVKAIYGESNMLKPGNRYLCLSTIKPLSKQTIPGNFDYKKYLASINVYNSIQLHDCLKQRTNISLIHLRNLVKEYIEKKTPKSKKYLLTFILADQSQVDRTVKDDISMLGISHMFAVSGYHVGLLVFGLKKLLQMLKVKANSQDFIMFIILLLYVVLAGYSASVIRAVFLFIGLRLSRKYSLNFSALDILSILFMVNLFVRPFAYFNTGFLLSYFITFVLLLSQKMLFRRPFFESLVMVSFIAFLATMPIVLLLYHRINLLTLVYNVILTLGLSFVILPLVYLTFLLPLFDSLLSFVISAYEYVLSVLAHVDIFVIKGTVNTPTILTFLYITIYVIYLKLEQRKYIYKELLIVVLLVFNGINANKLDIMKRVVFLDVHGDATLITDSFDRCNILIDTGDVDEYDLVINYLEGRHVSRIDYLIISHFHADHMGEMADILHEFDVRNVVTNRVGVNSNFVYSCGSLQLRFFLPKVQYLSENNNSLMTWIEINGKSLLFTGDAEREWEREWADIYKMEVDYLKVAHHGSVTSSTDVFLDGTKPFEAFIIVHRNNRNNHPDASVIERLESRKIKVFRTDELGSIEVIFIGHYQWKKYHKP